jgi:hypothetical protein
MSDKNGSVPDHSEQMLLLAGVAACVLGYVMPAIVFKGTGNAVHDLAMFEKLPVLSAITFAALAAALATRFLPQFQRFAQPATVAAIVLVLAPALFGFVHAIDAWSSLRATINQMAGTRNVFINPGPGYVPMLAGAAMLALSLRVRARREADQAST